MIAIQKKGKLPKSLRKFIKSHKFDLKNDCLYEKFRDECREGYKELQKLLIEEQNELCCYCMRRIEVYPSRNKNADKATIEHFKPKSKYKNLCLEYSNLLACCTGRDNNIRTCGQKKGNEELRVIPNPSCRKRKRFFCEAIYYKETGEISVRESFFSTEKEKLESFKDLNERLNLNNEILVEARKKKLQCMISKYKDWCSRKRKNKSKQEYLKQYVSKNGCFEYYGYVFFFFKIKIDQNE